MMIMPNIITRLPDVATRRDSDSRHPKNTDLAFRHNVSTEPIRSCDRLNILLEDGAIAHIPEGLGVGDTIELSPGWCAQVVDEDGNRSDAIGYGLTREAAINEVLYLHYGRVIACEVAA